MQKIDYDVSYFSKIIITYTHEWWEHKTHDGPYKNSSTNNDSRENADLLSHTLGSKIKRKINK